SRNGEAEPAAQHARNDAYTQPPVAHVPVGYA
ncbi:MAG: hypothetical protein QOI98_2746, partial [Solirubrobacteraceae bacterium]|nr:hypothetical protein [Solirubrobacteraceae bacterium]